MAYISRNNPTGLIAIGGETPASYHRSLEGYEGIVTDVIVDQFHSKYGKDGYVVGCVKVRIFEVDNGKSDELLDWAFPLDSTIQEYPLLGEKVKITKALGQHFYLRKTNLTNKLQENAMLNLDSQLNERPSKIRSSIVSENKEIEKEKHKFGEYFKPDSRVRQLKHFEGDVLIQGKMGNSIRFGSSQMDLTNKSLAPSLILRAGQAKDAEVNSCTTDAIHGLILEDINNDISSLWLTVDQVLDFEPITNTIGSFNRSLLDAPNIYDGAAAVLTSDKLLLTAKNGHIMMYSNNEIYMNSFSRIAMDTNESIVLTANLDFTVNGGRNFEVAVDEDIIFKAASDISMISSENFSLLSNKIYLGSIGDEREPMVGGMSLSMWLARLITVLAGNPGLIGVQKAGVPAVPPPSAALLPDFATYVHGLTPMGIPVVLNNIIVTGLQALYAELALPNTGTTLKQLFAGAPFNSQDNFTSINNQDASMIIVKNEFETGTRTKIENGSWELSKPFYRVT
jgi:hypothetical protein